MSCAQWGLSRSACVPCIPERLGLFEDVGAAIWVSSSAKALAGPHAAAAPDYLASLDHVHSR